MCLLSIALGGGVGVIVVRTTAISVAYCASVAAKVLACKRIQIGRAHTPSHHLIVSPSHSSHSSHHLTISPISPSSLSHHLTPISQQSHHLTHSPHLTRALRCLLVATTSTPAAFSRECLFFLRRMMIDDAGVVSGPGRVAPPSVSTLV